MINNMQYSEIAKQIFSAIDIIVDKKLESLAFDRCIVAEVTGKKTNGQYSCLFQDMTFGARTMNADADILEGDFVYILIPQNNFSNDKFIIGLKKRP